MQQEMQRSRARIIEMIDDKTRLESELQKLKHEKREVKVEVEAKQRRI